ncbi:TORTIFOLIA1-like protein 3 [Linum grandiflorum]
MAQSFKMKVLTLITKLSDRDTYTAAADQLESVAATLDGSTLPTFLSCILSTDSADKALVRKQCLRLLSLLSLLHSNSLSSFLPKIITYLTRRLRDLDSSIRSECVAAVSSLSSNVTKPPFSSAFLKPLSEAVFTEQDLNAQVGSALCLAAAIDSAPDPDPGRLGKALVSRLERLVKNDAYKAKSAGLVVLGSVIGVGGVRGYGGMSGLVKCLTGFLSHQDWAARKAAAEALCRLAIAERDALAEFKNQCLTVFENRRFDKVKATREVMSQMIEAWKQVPDVSDEPSPPPRSQASSRDEVADGRNAPSGSRKHYSPSTEPAQTRTRGVLSAVCTPANGFSSRKRGPVKSADQKNSPTMTQQQVERKKPLDWKVDVSVSDNSFTGVGDDTRMKQRIDDAPQSRLTKPETRRALFSRNSDDKAAKSSGFKSGSRVAPHDGNANCTVVTNSAENHNTNHKDSEELSLIRSQLLQIERQQSSLLDLLQRFIGSSQNGMSSLETRVHGLELALDEISYDLAVSNGRMANSHGTPCCRIPGADYLSSKLWGKGEDHHNPTSRLRSAGMRPRGSSHETFNLDNCRLHLQRRGGLIVNPLAEIHDSRATSEMGRQ